MTATYWIETAFPPAWEAAVAGIPLADYARDHTELREALDKFAA